MRTVLIWAIKQWAVVTAYWRFGTTYQSHLLGFLTLQDGAKRMSQNDMAITTICCVTAQKSAVLEETFYCHCFSTLLWNVIRKVTENKECFKSDGTNQLLTCADYVTILSKDIKITKRNTEALSVASMGTGIEAMLRNQSIRSCLTKCMCDAIQIGERLLPFTSETFVFPICILHT